MLSRRKKKVNRVKETKLNVEKFVGDILREVKFQESEKNRESDEKWWKFFEAAQIADMKKEVEELHEDFLRNTAKKHSECVKEIEKLNTKEPIGLEGIANISEFFEKTMKELQRNFLEEREEIYQKELLSILDVPDLTGSLESAVMKLGEEIFIQNQNLDVKLEGKLAKIAEERTIFNETFQQDAEEMRKHCETMISNLKSCVKNCPERAEKLSYIAEKEVKMIELKNIINRRRDKDFLYVILKENFKEIKEQCDKKLTIRDKRFFLRNKLNSIRDKLAKETRRERKNQENLTMISTEEITNLQKIFSCGQKLSNILESILKIDKDFSRVPPEKSSLIARSSEILADVMVLKNSREDLLRENEELCQCLKNYCNNKIIDN